VDTNPSVDLFPAYHDVTEKNMIMDDSYPAPKNRSKYKLRFRFYLWTPGRGLDSNSFELETMDSSCVT
jgi:hypothetical protein